MSWDIVLIHSRQKVESIEELDEEQLLPADFSGALESHFTKVIHNGSGRKIIGENFSIVFDTEENKEGIMILNLYGEGSIYALIDIAKQYNWQLFDTGLGEMIDLDNPANNGYNDFQKHIKEILKK